jgi:hypothetical protein
MSIPLVAINDYFINGYCDYFWLYYHRLLVIILLYVILNYFYRLLLDILSYFTLSHYIIF